MSKLNLKNETLAANMLQNVKGGNSTTVYSDPLPPMPKGGGRPGGKHIKP